LFVFFQFFSCNFVLKICTRALLKWSLARPDKVSLLLSQSLTNEHKLIKIKQQETVKCLFTLFPEIGIDPSTAVAIKMSENHFN